MASSDAEIKDGFNLPVWMKMKPTRDFEPFAASPPGQDDAFFIRYPNTKAMFGANLERDVAKIVKEPTGLKEKDWSKHTKPCQDVLHGIAPINTAANPISPKVLGTDEEFKGEGAACGNSVVKVAHQMISSTRSPRGFTVAAPAEEAAEPPDAARYDLMARRGSRSLPATPAHSPPGSPNSRRKNRGNRYFTSPFEPADDASHRSWLTMALLGFKKDLTTSTSTLAEEDALEARLHGSLAESVESLGPAPRNRAAPASAASLASSLASSSASASASASAAAAAAGPAPAAAKPAPAFRPRPSELREMNFWSPTSM
ncbi:pneumococcal serine-rich repeat protein-like isoform X2 [Cydia splendana]|uniref:pneumococcal serine-rich repeat protein-like isoform X2 n=1 Tax=Cydia splendana TaxID=1100963 RepID=UPI0028F4BD30